MAFVSSSLALLGLLLPGAQAFNNPPGVPVWCGKAYQAQNASFSPGGMLNPPKAGKSPLLDLKIRPRMSLYTSDEQYGSFIVDAPVSYTAGKAYANSTKPYDGGNGTQPFTTLYVDITDADSGQQLVGHQSVPVNSTANELQFSLAGLAPRTAPYRITVEGASLDGDQSYTAETELYRLPARADGGSVVRLDSLYDGMLIRTANSSAYEPIFPFSFYASWSGYFEGQPQNVQAWKDMGFNIVHVVPDASLPYGFNETEFDQFLAACDEAGLYVMYDMRWSYLNLSSVAVQVERIKDHPSMLLWYTGDEPDGNTDPLNGTSLAYARIKSLDAYHPVSLVLNCYNFYYEQYASGADVILEDVYPIGINATWSVRFDTPVNATYGDCGCDDCKGEFEDISTRLDRLAEYQSWIGGAPKPRWGVPQAFGGSEYWDRNPTPAEEVVMDMLSVNHGAKGLVAWTYPTEPDLVSIMGQLARVLSSPAVAAGFLLAAPTQPVAASGVDRLDAAAWHVGSSMLVSAVFLQYDDVSQTATLQLPGGAKPAAVSTSYWGNGGWTVSNGKLVKKGLKGLEADLFVVDLA